MSSSLAPCAMEECMLRRHDVDSAQEDLEETPGALSEELLCSYSVLVASGLSTMLSSTVRRTCLGQSGRRLTNHTVDGGCRAVKYSRYAYLSMCVAAFDTD